MEAILQTAVHTPWWVYLIGTYIIYIGVQASTTRVVSLKILAIVPAVFMVLSVQTLITTATDYISVSTWVFSMLTGILLGGWQVCCLDLKYDKKRLLIQLPGTWSTMIIMLIIFTGKYYFGYKSAVDPQYAEQIGFKLIMLAVSGVCTGVLVGRIVGYLYRFSASAEHVDLLN